MMHTTAATMNRKRDRKGEGKAFFWVPKIGAEVGVLWAAASKQNSADQPGVTQEELPSSASGNHGPAELTAADEEMEMTAGEGLTAADEERELTADEGHDEGLTAADEEMELTADEGLTAADE